MDFSKNKIILKAFYKKEGIEHLFEKDCFYLEDAFLEVDKIWNNVFNQIKTVKYLMIAEAPLWGKGNIKDKRYIYNPEMNNTQFFFRGDLEEVLKISIPNKKEFINICNQIGLLVVDISPFPLNEKYTSINYRDISVSKYKHLVSMTLPTYFAEKMKLVNRKKSPDIKVFFRYARVKNNFQELISKVLIDNKIINGSDEIGDVSQDGGGIDRSKLSQIIMSES